MEDVTQALSEALISLVESEAMYGAIDLDDTFGYKTNKDMFYYIKDNLNFDQLIWEFGDDTNPAWVHVSYVNDNENRNRCLKAYKKKGKTGYIQI